jgi:hypothetical protein
MVGPKMYHLLFEQFFFVCDMICTVFCSFIFNHIALLIADLVYLVTQVVGLNVVPRLPWIVPPLLQNAALVAWLGLDTAPTHPTKNGRTEEGVIFCFTCPT